MMHTRRHGRCCVTMAGMLALFIFLPDASALNESQELLFNSEELSIMFSVETSVTVVPTSHDYSISSLTANLTALPKNGQTQRVTMTLLEPTPEQRDSGFIFSWQEPAAGRHALRVEADIVTTRHRGEVRRKTSFPVDVPAGMRQYVESTESIDATDPDIVRLASELAAGRDDLYDVVHTLAVWSQKNIAYNLSTVTAEVTKPASWVLQNRQGVCDEVTVLFLALNRALGIPARFVSGVAYTDSPLFPERWGLHAWAEVYFPGTGWVPFDITYQEFGELDATHIRLLATRNPAETATRYSWRGRNVDVETKQLAIAASVNKAGAKKQPDIAMTLAPLEESVRFGAYNLLEAKVKNRRDIYRSAEVSISGVEGVQHLGEQRQWMLLKPHEEKSAYFIVKVDDNLNRRFIYTFPFHARAGTATANSSFTAASSGVQPSLVMLQKASEPVDERQYTHIAEMDCTAPHEMYTYETAALNCTLRNTGTTQLRNINVCSTACQTLNLGIGQHATVRFTEQFSTPGRHHITVRATSEQLNERADIRLRVHDEPKITLERMAPANVTFGEPFTLSFTLEKASASTPTNITARMENKRYQAAWALDALTGRQQLVAEMNGNLLEEGINTLPLHVSYYDANGRRYEETGTASVTLRDVTLFQKVQLLLLGFSAKIERLLA